MYMKIAKSIEIYLSWGLILMLPLARNHCFHFSRFVQSVANLVAKSLRNWVLWVSMGAQRWKERGSENFKKTSPQKYQQMSQICSQRRVPQRDFLEVFRVTIPGWSLRRPQTGSKAQKHVEMEALRCNSMYFSTITSYSLETCWRLFIHKWSMHTFPTLSGFFRIRGRGQRRETSEQHILQRVPT